MSAESILDTGYRRMKVCSWHRRYHWLQLIDSDEETDDWYIDEGDTVYRSRAISHCDSDVISRDFMTSTAH